MLKPPRILVADDEAKIGLMLQEILVDEGCIVTPFTYPLDALRALKSDRYDLLLTDLKMPVLDGLSLAKQALRIDPKLVIVVLTGFASTDSVIEALRLGVSDFLTKPFDLADLRRVVKHALQSRSLLRQDDRRLLSQLKQANLGLLKSRNDLSEKITLVQANLTQTNSVLERRVRDLSMLNDVSRVVNSVLDLEKLLEVYLELVSTKIGIRNCSIMLAESPGASSPPEFLRLVAAFGRAAKTLIGQCLPLETGIEGWVATNRIPVLVENLADPHRLQPHGPCKYRSGSFICVPLLVKDRLLGVMDVNEKHTGDPLNQDDLNLLTTIAGQVSIALENAKLYGLLQENALRTVQALASTLEAKDRYTSGHSERVTRYALAVAEHMHLPSAQIDRLRYASQLHDVGKIGVPEDILRKTSALDDREWHAIQEHPVIGERIIQPLDFLGEVGRIIRHHHERWDGHGYPDKLAGSQIPKLTRIMTVVDAYDAMTSERPYRHAKSAAEAMDELRRCRGSQFDPETTDTFLAVLDSLVASSAN